ncbi:MAG: 30S ribosomal protein S6 [Candidatus Levybacteria bacterium]|nr:30S ribosomal protein S6 [Candidatus Levybacteria bacterium]
MRTYELVLVLKPSLSEKERTKLLETIKTWLSDFKVVKEEDWGQKPLAYKIKKEIAGYYQMLMIESEKGVPPVGFEKRLMEHENVLRHLLLRQK